MDLEFLKLKFQFNQIIFKIGINKSNLIFHIIQLAEYVYPLKSQNAKITKMQGAVISIYWTLVNYFNFDTLAI